MKKYTILREWMVKVFKLFDTVSKDRGNGPRAGYRFANELQRAKAKL